MGDNYSFDDAYDSNSYGLFTLSWDGESFTFKLKVKAKETISVWAKREGKKFLIDFGAGDEEYEEGSLPNPIKKLIESKGGGPGGNSVRLPPRKVFINNSGHVRSYGEYASIWKTRFEAGDKTLEKPLPKALFASIAAFYQSI
ncbi:hypothetical protein [Methylobacterium sp. J-090]|uniref:hypothetical protein n=1 Tax=Methylobacterium sp. J-090 TaxID=2836666 RepID=UPI001FB8B94B|nr:hypothetical protein [Methylobacterium sp. J-090]MCJ2081720.1 hypothetical protein [Methylobacterium sp. J-090]